MLEKSEKSRKNAMKSFLKKKKIWKKILSKFLFSLFLKIHLKKIRKFFLPKNFSL